MLRIADNVYYSPADHNIDQPILAAVVGDRRVLMLDTGVSPFHASAFANELRELTGRSIDCVVLTHWHWDHVFGLKGVKCVSIGHKNLRKHMERLKSYSWDDASIDQRLGSGEEIEFCAVNLRKVYPPERNIEIMMPDIYYDGFMEIDLGGITCELHHVPTDHTDDSTALYVKENGILFLGDATGQNAYARIPYYKASSALRLLEFVKGFHARLIVESHGNPRSISGFLEDNEIIFSAARLVSGGIRDRRLLLDSLEREMKGRLPDDSSEVVDLFLNGEAYD